MEHYDVEFNEGDGCMVDDDGAMYFAVDWKAAPADVLEAVSEVLAFHETDLEMRLGDGGDDQVYFAIVKTVEKVGNAEVVKGPDGRKYTIPQD